jgi:hypothetical protein
MLTYNQEFNDWIIENKISPQLFFDIISTFTSHMLVIAEYSKVHTKIQSMLTERRSRGIQKDEIICYVPYNEATRRELVHVYVIPGNDETIAKIKATFKLKMFL